MKNDIISDAFKWLFIGLLTCFATSYITIETPTIFNAINRGPFIILAVISELIIAFALSLFIRKLDPLVAKIMYILYTALTGLTFSWILLAYTQASITYVFLVTSVIFGVFAFIGKNTKIDLMKWSTYLFIALISIILLEIINIFLLNQSLELGICILSIVVFAGYVAYDVKFALSKAEDMQTENIGIYCAFQLFIDFINLFIRLLRLFGKNRD